MASPRNRLLVTIPAAALLWIGVAGCSFSASTSTDLDIQKAQDEIAKSIQEQTGESATVQCPSPVKQEQGNSFDCTATFADGQTGTITVSQTDNDGNITWKLEPDVSPSPS